jgi:hypothetical protein
MAAPIWKTPKGNLGTIQEQEFYELDLLCILPDDPSPELEYKIIAGSLPPGIVLNETTGKVNGRPKDIYRFRGVPFDVSEDVTSVFCVRVINTKTNQVADRTFNLTVTGQDAPAIISNVEELGIVFDGSYAEFQITAIDLDRELLTYYISNGALPVGLSLDKSTGIISGVVEPNQFLPFGELVGWSTQAEWDLYPWDFSSRAISKRFEFDVSVTDGKEAVSRKFNIYVISKDSLTADNDVINVNGYYDTVTADLDIKRNPVLLTPSINLGTYLHDNYFAYQFQAKDYDNDIISYSLLVSENIGFDNENNGFDSTLLDFGNFELPPGLTLSEDTGWLYGYIPAMTPVQKEYRFGVRVYKRNYPEYTSRIVNFRITIVGDIKFVISWLSPTDLGSITAGGISEFAIEATNQFNKQLYYTLEIGSNSRLPQGLRLLENGLIVGRPSFEVTSFDKGTMTFDKNIIEYGQRLDETTLDTEYNFTVRVRDIDNNISATKNFKIKLLSNYTQPYESLYLRAYPGLEDKQLYRQLVYNTDIIPNEFVYRNGDPYFGKQANLDVLVMSGINASTASEYIEAMAINHYRKKLLIGEPEIAQALDENGNVKYEVLYLSMRDDNGPTAKSLDLRTKINRTVRIDSENPSIDLNYFTVNSYDRIVYPNALTAMRSQIKDTLGFVDREVLPLWMTSKQENGKISYWTPAMVLTYLKPGKGKQAKFLLNKLFDFDLKDISFEVDRYIWDCNLSKNYNAITNTYLDSSLTTFDADIRQGSDILNYEFNADGSTVIFDLQIAIEVGNIEVIVEKYILLFDSSLVLDKSTLIEDVDFYRDNTTIVFYEAPEFSSTVKINYVRSELFEVDYALTIPFNSIDGMTTDYVDDVLGGLDFAITVYDGKNVIFARQEQYPGYLGEEDGWIQNLNMWDDGSPWDDPVLGFDNYRIVPGYNENQMDPDIQNERAGIWKINLDENGLLRLEFIQEIFPQQRILVRYGNLYGGKIVRYGPVVRFDIGETVPSYVIISEVIRGVETIFDGGSTRFVESISIYQAPDEGDKYLAFPRVNIFA